MHSTELYRKIHLAMDAKKSVVVYVPCPWLHGYIATRTHDVLLLLQGRNQVLDVDVCETPGTLMVHVDMCREPLPQAV